MGEVENKNNGFLDCECNTYVPPIEQAETAEHMTSTTGKKDVIEGYTLFHYAASVGNVHILRILFEKAPREILRCCQPVHPIHLAIIGGHKKCVNLIIDEARKGTTISQSFQSVYH